MPKKYTVIEVDGDRSYYACKDVTQREFDHWYSTNYAAGSIRSHRRVQDDARKVVFHVTRTPGTHFQLPKILGD